MLTTFSPIQVFQILYTSPWANLLRIVHDCKQFLNGESRRMRKFSPNVDFEHVYKLIFTKDSFVLPIIMQQLVMEIGVWKIWPNWWVVTLIWRIIFASHAPQQQSSTPPPLPSMHVSCPRRMPECVCFAYVSPSVCPTCVAMLRCVNVDCSDNCEVCFDYLHFDIIFNPMVGGNYKSSSGKNMCYHVFKSIIWQRGRR